MIDLQDQLFSFFLSFIYFFFFLLGDTLWFILAEGNINMASELVSSATSDKLAEMDWTKNIEICELVARDHR